MATSSLSPIVSDDQKAYWLICDSRRNNNLFNTYEFILPITVESNESLIVGATEAKTTIVLINSADPNNSLSTTIAVAGDSRALSASYSSNTISVTTESPYVVVSVLVKPGRSQNAYAGALLTFNSSTNSANIPEGTYYVLTVGGGGGGGGSMSRDQNGTSPAGPTQATASPGGGGASGGFAASKITLNATQNVLTVGSGGGGGNNTPIQASSAGPPAPAPSGGTGGTTSFSNVSATGGGGGGGGRLSLNTSIAGAGGTAAPGGSAGGSGNSIGSESPYYAAYFSSLTSASGSGGRFYNIFPNAPGGTNDSTAVSGNIGSGGGSSMPNPTTIAVQQATGRGGGGTGGVIRAPQPGNTNSFSTGTPGSPGAVYILRAE